MPRGIYKRAKTKKVAPSSQPVAQTLDMTLPVLDIGLRIKLVVNSRVVGTLIATTDRITFVRPKGKNASKPRSSMSYERLASLFESGLLE